MSITGIRVALMFGAAAGALAIASTAGAAQDASTVAEANTAREQIIVTARRKEENIQDVPVAVTALDQEALEDLVVNNIADLNKLAPGLQVGGTITRDGGGGPNIRAQPTGTNSGTTSVVSYFAEVPNFPTAFFDLENIQVLKGPQGTLFGETATGGAILYTPRKPTNDFSARAGVQVGNYDYKQFDAAIGGPIVDDKLMVRVAGRWRKRDGFTQAIYSDGSPPDMIDDVDNAQWRASIVWRPIENIETYTIYAGRRSSDRGPSHLITYADPRFLSAARRNQIPASVPQVAAGYQFYSGAPAPAGMTWSDIIGNALARQNAAGPRTAFRNYHVDQDSTSHGVVNQTRWDILDNLTFKNIFGLNWGTARGPGSGNYDGIDAPLFDSRGVLSPGSTYPNGDWGKLGGWSSRDWSEEAQLLGTLFDGRVDWQGGFYYRISASRDYETGTGNVIFGSLSGFPAPASFCTDAGVPSPCTRARRGHSKTYAVYGQATFAVTDDINLTGGFRHTWDTTTSFETAAETQFITFNGFPQAVSFAGTPTIPGANELSTVTPLAQANTYTVTADWRVTDAVLLYLAHRTGYTRGGINSTAPIDSPKRTFQPERIKDIELGVKADWSLGDVTARTNIALYRNWYSDVQRSDVIPGTGFSILDNAGDSIIQGVEFENAITFSEWFDVRANLSFIDAHFTNWLENSTCAAQRYRPGCETLSAANATATQLLIDHANGVITAVVSPAPFTPLFFEPDRFRGAAKWTASIQPTVHLTPWLGEDISIGANVYYRSSYAAFTISGAYFAGLTPDPRPGVFGSGNPFISDPYTLVDLQADWRNIGDSRVSIGARVTNLMNTVYSLSGALGHITTSGVGAGYAGEPRMWFMDVRVDF